MASGHFCAICSKALRVNIEGVLPLKQQVNLFQMHSVSCWEAAPPVLGEGGVPARAAQTQLKYVHPEGPRASGVAQGPPSYVGLWMSTSRKSRLSRCALQLALMGARSRGTCSGVAALALGQGLRTRATLGPAAPGQPRGVGPCCVGPGLLVWCWPFAAGLVMSAWPPCSAPATSCTVVLCSHLLAGAQCS